MNSIWLGFSWPPNLSHSAYFRRGSPFLNLTRRSSFHRVIKATKRVPATRRRQERKDHEIQSAAPITSCSLLFLPAFFFSLLRCFQSPVLWLYFRVVCTLITKGSDCLLPCCLMFLPKRFTGSQGKSP